MGQTVQPLDAGVLRQPSRFNNLPRHRIGHPAAIEHVTALSERLSMKAQDQIGYAAKPKEWIRLACVALVVFSGSFSLAANSSRSTRAARYFHISPELGRLADARQQGKVADQTIRVIVQFKEKPTNSHIRKMAGFGGRHLQALSLVKGGVFTVPLSALPLLEKESDIVYVSPDRPVSGASTW